MSKLLAMMMADSQPQSMYAVIQGSPTVQGGTITNFSDTNYLQSATNFVSLTDHNFEVVIKLASVGVGEKGFRIVWNVTNQFLFAFTSTGSPCFCVRTKKTTDEGYEDRYVYDWTYTTYTDNPIWLKFSKVDTTFRLQYATTENRYSTGVTYTLEEGELVSYLELPFKLMKNANWSNTNVVLDLPHCSIKIDNTRYSLQQVVGYTKVGTPTVNDGIASGFSATDYLKTTLLPDFSGNVEIVIKFNTSTFTGTMMSWVTSGVQCWVRFNAGNALNVFFAGILDVSTSHLSVSGHYVFSANTDYYIKIIKTSNNTLYIYYSTDGTHYTLDATTQNTNTGTVTVSSYFRIGVNGAYTPDEPFDGTIDLNATYIKTNGQLWFNGIEA